MTQPLANAELAVMDLLWDSKKPMTAREIRERLYPDEKKAQHGTVQRLLQRLEDKGCVDRDKTHAVHFFTALIERDAYAAEQLEQLADKLTAGSFAPMITHLVEHKKISAKDIHRIREILDQHEANAGKKSARKATHKAPGRRGRRS